LLGGNVNGGERTGAIQDRELTGVAPVRFYPVARAPRNQGRRNHVAVNAAARQRALQLEAAWPRLVAALHGRGP
jgi:hypothetical protein